MLLTKKKKQNYNSCSNSSSCNNTNNIYKKHFLPYIRIKTKSGNLKHFINNIEVKDKHRLNRLNKIYVPPAYKDVLVAKSPNYKIQIIGIDKKGRKQYIYNTDYVKKQNTKKYNDMSCIGRKIMNIEDKNKHNILKIYNNLKNPYFNLTIDDLLEIILCFLIKYHFRIGNKKYEKEYNSVGLTTLKKTYCIK